MGDVSMSLEQHAADWWHEQHKVDYWHATPEEQASLYHAWVIVAFADMSTSGE